MKKFYLASLLAIACVFNAAPAKAQLSNLLNQVVSATTSAAESNSSSTGSIISNLISSVTGSLTTTQENLVGSWSYNEPRVQFESENALTQAGGTIVASSVEEKLASIYKKVGIKEGTMVFTFAKDGTCTYGVGSIERNGTYTFDSTEKTVTITTSTGRAVKAYVTISGSNMSLTFDGTKLLTLFKTISSKMSALSTVSAIAGQYSGMKIGFEFTAKN